MPKQETFFEEVSGDHRVEVLKSYDEQYAKEAFEGMDEDALQHLWTSLKPEDTYEPADLPKPEDSEYEVFLWDELVRHAREEWNTFSYFIVNVYTGKRSESLYVSPDWPSAESFAKSRVAAIQ